MSKRALLLLLAAGLVALTAVGVGWGTSVSPQKLVRPLGSLPARLGQWQALARVQTLDARTLAVLKPDDYLLRAYRSPQGDICWVLLAYFGVQEHGRMYHSPRICMGGAGWEMSERQEVTVEAGGRPHTLSAFVMRREIQTMQVLYWFQGRGRLQAASGGARMQMFWDNLFLGRSDGLQARITSLVPDQGEPARALALQENLASQLIPALEDILPPRDLAGH